MLNYTPAPIYLLFGDLLKKTRKCFRPTPIALLLVTALHTTEANAGVYFDPAFLADDPSKVADLSHFERGDTSLPGIYRVDIFVNDKSIGTDDIDFQPRNAATTKTTNSASLSACIPVEKISQLNINLAAVPALANLDAGRCVQLENYIPDAISNLNLEKLRLDISIPQAMLNKSARGEVPIESWDNGITAALINYNFVGSNSRGDFNQDNYFLNLDSGINLDAWRLRNFSTWNKSGKNAKGNWQNINSYAQRNIVSLKSNLTIGQANSSSDVFDSVGYQGGQLNSDDSMLADSQRGFAPIVRGIARSNAQVTIRQNGYVIYETFVPSGAFVIDDLFPTGSSGNLQVSVTEADGSINSYTVPYATVPKLQREGRMKYSLTGGKIRSNRDQETPPFAQGSLLWGLPHNTTVYTGTQWSNNYTAFLLGVGKNMGDWGAVSLDATTANSTLVDDSKHSGQSVRLLYGKSLSSLGTNLQLAGYRYSTQGFYTLADTTNRMMVGNHDVAMQDGVVSVKPSLAGYYNLYYTPRGNLQLTVNQRVEAAGTNGTAFLSANQKSYWNTNKTNELFQVGYNTNINNINYSLAYNYNKNPWLSNADQAFSLGVSFPLNRWLSSGGTPRRNTNNMYANYRNTMDNHGKMQQSAGVSGSLLDKNNLSYSLQQSYANRGGDTSSNASMNYRGTYGTANAGYNYSGGDTRINYGLRGGVVVHSEGVTLSQPLSDANVLIKAQGAKGVSVANGTGVKTDLWGYAVLPSASAYRNNRVALDTNTLANNIELDNAALNVVPTRGALVKADFNARIGVRSLMSLTYQGKAVPFGALVTQPGVDNPSIVSDDGVVYLSGLPLSGQLQVRWADGPQGQCSAQYQLPENSEHNEISYATAECV
ncbi:fimbrial biogenesis usher protein [Yersinia mollaretii ATCC 43969]|nr:fimbrial biogenesis usher protein [Yersinia mollaretii ATCC 43969]